MKTKIVYCLVSDNTDYYYEQLLISLCSLRKHNPTAEVEVLCDNATFDTLIDSRCGIYDYNVNVHPVETPNGWSKWERSRFLKTNLRKLTAGDYIFLDVDTVICSSLECVDDIGFEVAAVTDGHINSVLKKYSECSKESEFWIWHEAKKAKLDISGLWHFNSGVMYVKDNKHTHDLYDKWSEIFGDLLKYGVKADQVPLLLANNVMNNIISALDPAMNCQVFFYEGRRNVFGAKIIHYFPGHFRTILSYPLFMDSIKETGKLNGVIQRIIDDPYHFFDRESMIIMGDDVTFFDTPFLRRTYYDSPKTFKFFVSSMSFYIRVKNKINRLLHRVLSVH